MNNLDKAAEILKTSWCAGSYRETRDGKSSFCSVGALAQVLAPEIFVMEDEVPFGQQNPFADEITKKWLEVTDSRETKILADTILEYHGDEIGTTNPEMIVITFNDEIAESSDEVITMFQKAAIRFDELV